MQQSADTKSIVASLQHRKGTRRHGH